MNKRYFVFSAFVIILLLVAVQPVHAVQGQVANRHVAFIQVERNRLSSAAPTSNIPQVSISTPSHPVGMDSGRTRLVPYSFTESGNGAGRITSRQYQFFTQYDVPLSDPIGPYPASITISPLATKEWNEDVYLPKSVMDKARAMDEYAIVLKTTFSGTSSSGIPFATEASLLILFPPAAFSKDTPGNGSEVQPASPSLHWNSSIGAIDYEYCFDTVDNNSCDTDWTGTYWPGTYDTNVALQNLPVGTTFYWQVRANNTAGTTYADNGNWWSFHTAIIPPTLVLPANQEVLHHKRPTFDWNDVNGAQSYTLQASRVNTFASLALDVSVTDSTYTITKDLDTQRLYYWRVRTNTVSGSSNWSGVRTFTTGAPPSTPSLSSPGNNNLVAGPSPLFNWNNSTLPPSVVFDRYEIQIATDEGFVNITYDHDVAGITNSQDHAAILAPGTTYYWRVRSFSTIGDYSAWSRVRSVRIKFAAPTLSQPTSGTTVGNLKPAFSWSGISGATGYTIQISKSNTFGSLVHNKTVAVANFTLGSNLTPATTYYWRVRANGLYGPGNWSAVFSFTTP